jgi:hypothetical protein
VYDLAQIIFGQFGGVDIYVDEKQMIRYNYFNKTHAFSEKITTCVDIYKDENNEFLYVYCIVGHSKKYYLNKEHNSINERYIERPGVYKKVGEFNIITGLQYNKNLYKGLRDYYICKNKIDNSCSISNRKYNDDDGFESNRNYYTECDKLIYIENMNHRPTIFENIILRRNRQVITGIKNDKAKTARGSRTSVLKYIFIRQEIEYITEADQNAIIDEIFGIQSNKNQHNNIVNEQIKILLNHYRRKVYNTVCKGIKDSIPKPEEKHSESLIPKPEEKHSESLIPKPEENHSKSLIPKPEEKHSESLIPKLDNMMSYKTVMKGKKKQSMATLTEKECQKLLCIREGGETEICIKEFRIRCDLITDTHIIEIKNYNERYSGIKVLIYATALNNNNLIPRIHLFGHNNNRDVIMEKVCKKYKIDLTYETNNETKYIVCNNLLINNINVVKNKN